MPSFKDKKKSYTRISARPFLKSGIVLRVNGFLLTKSKSKNVIQIDTWNKRISQNKTVAATNEKPLKYTL